jgi:sulfur-carrier protein adenylyltransferase/sulfurtransferase
LIWWAKLPGRALSEKDDVLALAARSDWLKVFEWRLDGIVRIRIDFEISVNEQTYELSLVYPELFPDTPSMVVPKDPKRLSGHQYGSAGELCLEWRADNWHPDITGAMMIESAYHLLSTEKGKESGEVDSAHSITVGQRVRSARYRLLVDENALYGLMRMAPGSHAPVAVSEHEYGDTWVGVLTRIGTKEEPLWSAPPLLKSGAAIFSGTVFRLPNGASIPDPLDKEALTALMGERVGEWAAEHASKKYTVVLIVTDDDLKLYEVQDPLGEHKVITYRTIVVPDHVSRLPESLAALAGKRVGIVGCGSVGSKVAVSLARSGVGNFVLVDSDILFTHNLVRNELDRRGVGINKTDAVKQAIEEINPFCTVETRDLLLGRQESAQAHATAATKLSKCDVIVDGTADLRAFGICGAIAQAYQKPLIWGHVYEGGIGGLVARARPGLDPIPYAARRQIDGWFQQNGIPWKSSPEGRDYETEDQGKPLIATDAEVGIIAMHIARFAVDVLSEESSAFPASAYVVGFAARWIFTQPFDTWPITLVAEGRWGPAEEEDRQSNLETLIAQLLPDSDAAG